MVEILQVLTVLFVSVAMALSLAHALEFPGKLRLSKEEYLTVQPIYYPGFTIGGVAEPASLLAMVALLFLTPAWGTAFWLTAAAFAALLAMHATYWLLTHPVNKFWLKDFKLSGAGSAFFSFDPVRQADASGKPEWTLLRDRWEYSHVVRAGFGLMSLALLVTALTV